MVTWEPRAFSFVRNSRLAFPTTRLGRAGLGWAGLVDWLALSKTRLPSPPIKEERDTVFPDPSMHVIRLSVPPSPFLP